jgi:hypothetical protein
LTKTSANIKHLSMCVFTADEAVKVAVVLSHDDFTIARKNLAAITLLDLNLAHYVFQYGMTTAWVPT